MCIASLDGKRIWLLKWYNNSTNRAWLFDYVKHRPVYISYYIPKYHLAYEITMRKKWREQSAGSTACDEPGEDFDALRVFVSGNGMYPGLPQNKCLKNHEKPLDFGETHLKPVLSQLVLTQIRSSFSEASPVSDLAKTCGSKGFYTMKTLRRIATWAWGTPISFPFPEHIPCLFHFPRHSASHFHATWLQLSAIAAMAPSSSHPRAPNLLAILARWLGRDSPRHRLKLRIATWRRGYPARLTWLTIPWEENSLNQWMLTDSESEGCPILLGTETNLTHVSWCTHEIRNFNCKHLKKET
jgi:hypothetical protein